ncbi:alpha/beta-hydrolase [Gonapodya prolifera JEL478]|uniref:Alpha/beta-hydrolase n=1 Tax=Gonapodya prolifera (strain JEL478) TaxID=1344416 RepID=A0A139ATA4_GONPJ|nr:alpha/beta-hydrolase [Gonapodya prolifera JEL478]|eukprot:KXS19970.1 alpha/beta-hydrolase [Gonapodya prolifera JEL478]
MQQPSRSCAGCTKPFGWFSSGVLCPNPPIGASEAPTKPDAQSPTLGCGKRFCSACTNFALVTASDADAAIASGDLAKAYVRTFCRTCFKNAGPLDWTSTEGAQADGVDLLEPSGDAAPTGATIFWAHGGGGSRLMFRPHAEALAASGYRCVLFDFPGHGRLMDAPLSMDTAIERIVSVVQKYGSKEGGKNVYVGGSLGGYIGMEMLARHPTLFSSAVICMCGQCVGHGAGLAARLGLVLLSHLSSWLSSATLLTSMRSTFSANGNMDQKMMLDTALRTGFYFEQNMQQIEILRASDPAAALAKYPAPVLFCNGSKDHRDSEKKWLSVSNGANGGKSKLICYEGGDHGFSHDKRFKDTFIEEIKTFISA